MTVRVAHIGTGNVGRLALTGLIANPQFELTGVCVSSEAKVGNDAGELAGLGVSTGVAATNDLEDVLADKPDCAVYCAMGDNRLPQAIDDVRRILAAGINVVGSAPVVLQYPWHVLPDQYITPLEEAAAQGNSSLYINGVDPGFATDLIPLAFAQTCQRIEQIRCMEIADYATYDGATVMFDVMGFGKPLDDVPLLFQPGVLSMAWGCAIRQLAAGLGIELDEITDSCMARAGSRGLRHRHGTHRQGHRRGAAVRHPRHARRPARHRRRARHPVARRSAPRLAAACTARRLVPGGNRRRAVIPGGHLPVEQQRRPQPRRDRRRGGPDRQRDPRRGRGATGHQNHARPAADHRQGAVRAPKWNRF